MYGRASALLLGSVPSWVVHETGEQRAPMTTVVLHSPCVEGERAMWVPEGREALFTRLLADSPLRRRLMPARRGRLRGATRLTCSFEPARRRGVVRVWRPGADLVDAVSSKVGWMLKGSMEHVTVLLPLRREVAARAGELEARGLFFGGFVPDLDGEDTLVLQALSRNLLDASTIAVQGDEAELLRDEVLRGWGRAMRSRAADDSGRSAGA
jgi:hypothetical protein